MCRPEIQAIFGHPRFFQGARQDAKTRRTQRKDQGRSGGCGGDVEGMWEMKCRRAYHVTLAPTRQRGDAGGPDNSLSGSRSDKRLATTVAPCANIERNTSSAYGARTTSCPCRPACNVGKNGTHNPARGLPWSLNTPHPRPLSRKGRGERKLLRRYARARRRRQFVAGDLFRVSYVELAAADCLVVPGFAFDRREAGQLGRLFRVAR